MKKYECISLLVNYPGYFVCRKGMLWITWPGSGDILLQEGERLKISEGHPAGSVLIQGLAGENSWDFIPPEDNPRCTPGVLLQTAGLG